MAINHVPIDQSKPRGNKLRHTRDLAHHFLTHLAEMKGIISECQDGEDYSHMEDQFGIPAGEGPKVEFLVNSLSEKVTVDTSVTGLKSALEAFVNQLG